MNIWVTQTGECYPFQENVILMRTGMLAEALLKRGHAVTWWGATFYHPEKIKLFNSYKEIKQKERYKINLLPGISYKNNLSFRRYLHQKKIGFHFKKKILDKPIPDVIITSMPIYDLTFEAVKFAKNRGIPVLVDVRDLWPDNIVNKLPFGLRTVGKMALFRDFQKIQWALKNCDGIIGVSQGFLNWGLKYADRPKNDFDRVFYIGSRTPEEQLDNSISKNLTFQKQFELFKHKKIFMFLGTFGHSYELELIVQVAKKIRYMNRDDIHFVLAGDGEHFEKIKKLSIGLPNISLPGFLKRNDAWRLLSSAYAGLNPFKSMPDALNNKAMQYLAFGLPVISSLEGEMIGILDKNNIGFSYKPGDIFALTKNILKLANDPILRDEMKIKAKKIYENKG
jgi:glycosyltransferase involved in cell wall biosynthesis